MKKFIIKQLNLKFYILCEIFKLAHYSITVVIYSHSNNSIDNSF